MSLFNDWLISLVTFTIKNAWNRDREKLRKGTVELPDRQRPVTLTCRAVVFVRRLKLKTKAAPCRQKFIIS